MPESRIPRYYAPKGHSTTIDLTVSINGHLHFQKGWTHTFPRELL